MADVFGVDRKVKGAEQIVNSSGVLVSIGGPIYLVQQLDINYQRNITAIYELGTENVYAGTQNPQGTCQINRAIGLGGEALKTFATENCKAEDILVKNGEGKCTDKFGTLKMPNSMLQGATIGARAGEAMVTEQATYWIGSLDIV